MLEVRQGQNDSGTKALFTNSRGKATRSCECRISAVRFFVKKEKSRGRGNGERKFSA